MDLPSVLVDVTIIGFWISPPEINLSSSSVASYSLVGYYYF
jgi:hypothetical protein